MSGITTSPESFARPVTPWWRGLLALAGLERRSGRRAWLIGLLLAAGLTGLALGQFALRPWLAGRQVRAYFLEHAQAAPGGLSLLAYQGLDLMSPPRDLGVSARFAYAGVGEFPAGRPTYFALRWLGTLDIPRAGVYGLGGVADDGLMVLVNGRPVARDLGEAPPREIWGRVSLAAGPQALEVLYVQMGGGASCVLAWQPPGEKKQPLPAGRLRPLAPGAPLAPITRLRLAGGLIPRAWSTYDPFIGGRHWRTSW